LQNPSDNYSFDDQQAEHNKIDSTVSKLFEDHGCIIRRTGYHDVFPIDVWKMVQSDSLNMVYHYLRGFPDYEIIPKKYPGSSFYVDYKASMQKHYVYVESLPWALNVERTPKKRTMYIYHNKHWNILKCWFADDAFALNKIRSIKYRKQKLLPPWAIQKIQYFLKHPVPYPTDEIAAFNASGDCNTVIFKEDAMKFLNLNELFQFNIFQ